MYYNIRSFKRLKGRQGKGEKNPNIKQRMENIKLQLSKTKK